MKKTGSKEGQREVIKKFLTEKGFTENQVKIMTRKGGKKAPPVEWTDEEMKDAMHQRRLGKDLYYHLFGDAWGVNPKFPMPSKNRITSWIKDKGGEEKIERFECKVKGCPPNKKILYSQEQYDRHMHLHNTLLCPTCGKGFPAHLRKKLITHIEYIHYGHKRWKCKVCDKAFVSEINGLCHINVHHLKNCLNEKEFNSRRAEFIRVARPYIEKIPLNLEDASSATPQTHNQPQKRKRKRKVQQDDENWEIQDAVKSIEQEY